MMRYYFHILIFLIIFSSVSSLYSPYYRRCRLQETKVDEDAIALQELQIELVPNYYQKQTSNPVINPQAQLEYQDVQFYFHSYIDAGGSGQVYLIQDAKTNTGKIAKRYFKQRPLQFKRENYIMKTMNYSIQWYKSCQGEQRCPPNATHFNTMAIYPHKQSIVLRKLQFDLEQAPLIFYKLLKELDKTHKVGIIHHDIKMGNILVNSIGPNFKFYEIQLIDWNLATFYHTGGIQYGKRGTVCYYAPQQMLKGKSITPVVDIWALAVVMFTFYTDQKPFSLNCKNDNFKAIISLVGGDKILSLFKKYRFSSSDYLKIIKQIQNNPSHYPSRNLYNFKPKVNKDAYTTQLVDVFMRMLEPDPELRATPEELMKMKYFSKIKVMPQMYYYKNKKKVKTISQHNQPNKSAI